MKKKVICTIITLLTVCSIGTMSTGVAQIYRQSSALQKAGNAGNFFCEVEYTQHTSTHT